MERAFGIRGDGKVELNIGCIVPSSQEAIKAYSASRLAFFPIKGKRWRMKLPLDASSPKTVVIFGAARGGTTMVARVVQSLGIHLGDDIGINFEDDAFNLQKLQLLPSKEPEALKASLLQTIQERNQARDVWGWKYPNAARYLPLILPALRNPLFICVFRDCISTSSRMLGARMRQGQNPLNTLDANLSVQRENLNLLRDSNVPSLLCSYEKAISDPRDFVKTLANFVGVDLNKRALKAAMEQISPGGYIRD